MKKVLSVVLVLVSVLTLFSSCKSNKPVESGDYTYVILEDNTAKITKYNGTEDIITLDIPSYLDDYTVTVIGAEAFANVQTISTVNFPDTVTKVEERAFAGSSIKKALMNRSEITEIGAYAFSECKNLIQVDVSHTTVSIGEYAFYYCEKLKFATFRSDVETIGQFIFDACPVVTMRIKKEATNLQRYAENYLLETEITNA